MDENKVLWKKCVEFHGHECGGLTIGYKAALYAKILYNQANLIAGLPLEDPSAYTDMVAQLMQ